MDVARLSYKPGWTFKRSERRSGDLLCVYATTPDSQKPGHIRTTQHMFEIPDDGRDLIRWVYDRLLDCERHECGEFFSYAGHRPFYPNHQDEGSPYAHVEREAPC